MQSCKIACYTPTWTTAVSSEVHVYTTILVMCMTEKDTQIVIWAWFGFIICHASRCVCTFKCVVHIIRILGGKHYCVSFRFFLILPIALKLPRLKDFGEFLSACILFSLGNLIPGTFLWTLYWYLITEVLDYPYLAIYSKFHCSERRTETTLLGCPSLECN